MHDDRALGELAWQARQVVSAPWQATLGIAGGEPDTEGPTDIGLSDDAGAPVFHCPVDSFLADAALLRTEAALVVCGRPDEHPIIVRIEGVLVRQDDPRTALDPGGDWVARVQLVPTRVIVRGREDDRALLVPVTVYSGLLSDERRADPLVSAGQRLVEHQNAHHGEQLRSYIARQLQVPLEEVVAASLDRVDAHGLGLSWITSDGGHRADIAFPHPARCPQALVCLLGQALEA